MIGAAVFDQLEQTIRARRGADPGTSYVAWLQAAGVAKIAKKLGEEAVETVIAALGESDEALVGEAADLVFHLLILLEARGLSLADVAAELARREGVSGHEEKAARSR
jgi:phosphoribosyl-ATP pyrophosphohydrolase